LLDEIPPVDETGRAAVPPTATMDSVTTVATPKTVYSMSFPRNTEAASFLLAAYVLTRDHISITIYSDAQWRIILEYLGIATTAVRCA
jgi:hypothetical protein